MGLEVGTYINDLVTTNPIGATDTKGQGDDHLRLIKLTLKNTFPNAVGPRKFQENTDSALDTLTWTLYRKAATPAPNDLLGSYSISGDNSVGVEKVYARLQAVIIDAVNGTEDGAWIVKTMVAGAEATLATFFGGALALGTDVGIFFAGTGAAITRTNLGVQTLDATLTALAAFNTNGILTQTAADTFTGRTLAGTAAEITVANGDGVAGAPTFSLPAALTFTGKTVTGGAFNGGAFNGTLGAITPNTVSGTTGAFTGAVAAGGNLTSTGGNVQATVGSMIAGSGVFAPLAAGTIVLRPNTAGSATGQMTVATNGNVTASGDLTANSDSRLKDDVKPFPRDLALRMVKAIQPIKFRRRDTRELGIGFIAQDVEPFAPELVKHSNRGAVDDTLSLAYPNMVAVLWEAVRDLQERAG